MGLALDESNADDEIFKDRDVTYIVNKSLFEEVKPVTIDYTKTAYGEGFKLSSSLNAAAGGCGSSCSTC